MSATNLKACPTELTTAINLEFTARGGTVESQRNLFCPHYDDCLDEAVNRGWSSFTCVKCPLFSNRLAPARNRRGIDLYATQRRAG